jgi:hypothetical protein
VKERPGDPKIRANFKSVKRRNSVPFQDASIVGLVKKGFFIGEFT